MSHRIRPKLTYANVIATLALFAALGGVAWAATALPPHSVGTKQLKKGAVTSAKVRDGSLLARDFKAGQLPAGAQGPPGASGAASVITRYGPEITLANGQGKGSYAACAPGEVATGGGYELLEGLPANSNYFIGANRASNEFPPGIHPVPDDGTPANGWLVSITNTTTASFKFRSYAQCAAP